MPVQLKFDKKTFTNYYQWGDHGKKYYFHTLEGQSKAKIKAERQGKAIEWRKHQKISR